MAACHQPTTRPLAHPNRQSSLIMLSGHPIKYTTLTDATLSTAPHLKRRSEVDAQDRHAAHEVDVCDKVAGCWIMLMIALRSLFIVPTRLIPTYSYEKRDFFYDKNPNIDDSGV